MGDQEPRAVLLTDQEREEIAEALECLACTYEKAAENVYSYVNPLTPTRR